MSYIIEAWNINQQGTIALINFIETCVVGRMYSFYLHWKLTSTVFVLPYEIIFTEQFRSRDRQPCLLT